jgi:hypothetical protein
MPTSGDAWRIVADERWIEILVLKERVRALEAGMRHIMISDHITAEQAKCIAKDLLQKE